MLMLAGTGASGVSSRGSEGSGQQGRSAGRGRHSLGAVQLPLPPQGKASWEPGSWILPLAAMGGERWESRQRNTHLCWECAGSRAGIGGRWSAGRPGRTGCLQQQVRKLLRRPQRASTFPPPSWDPLASLNQTRVAFPPLLLTKVGLTGTALDLHPFGPSLNEKMADQLFQRVP